MHTVNIEALVIRRSQNVNSFGLRGIWIITTAAGRVFEFAASQLDAERYQVGEFVQVPFHVTTKNPAHELARQIGDCAIPAKDVPTFLRKFNATLADKWIAHKKANAITAIPAEPVAPYVSSVGTYNVADILNQPE